MAYLVLVAKSFTYILLFHLLTLWGHGALFLLTQEKYFLHPMLLLGNCSSLLPLSSLEESQGLVPWNLGSQGVCYPVWTRVLAVGVRGWCITQVKPVTDLPLSLWSQAGKRGFFFLLDQNLQGYEPSPACGLQRSEPLRKWNLTPQSAQLWYPYVFHFAVFSWPPRFMKGHLLFLLWLIFENSREVHALYF